MNFKEEKMNRKLHLDFLRIIAIYMVLFNHTGNAGFTLFTVSRDSRFYVFYLFNAIFIKIAVPLFFMISGALLLPNKNGGGMIKNFRRFFRFLAILIICSLISYIYNCYSLKENFNLNTFLVTLYSSQVTVAYWYLYAYLGYILMLPLLRRLANNMSNRDFLYIIKIYFCFKIITIIQFFIWKGEVNLNSFLQVFINADYIFYPLLGYFIEWRIPKTFYSKKNIYKLIIISCLSIIVSACLTQYYCELINEWEEGTCQLFFNTLIFIPSFSVYVLAKMWFETHRVSNMISKIITVLGGCTFGIYLFEQIYRKETYFVYRYLFPYFHAFLACLIWIFSACTLGFLITSILKHIPIIRKYI